MLKNGLGRNSAFLSGVNYFFRLTTIISPEQRQLLSGAGDSPPLFAFLVS